MLDWQLMLTGQQVTLAQQVLQHMGILAGFAGMCWRGLMPAVHAPTRKHAYGVFTPCVCAETYKA